LLRQAFKAGAELAVLPELFNTGYMAFCPDFRPPTVKGSTGRPGRIFATGAETGGMAIAAGFVERDGPHLHDSLGFVTPRRGDVHVYRKTEPRGSGNGPDSSRGRSPLVVPTRLGTDRLRDLRGHDLSASSGQDYRDRIDLAVITAAWPEFADRITGRKHWLFGHVGTALGRRYPGGSPEDLGIPVVFANQLRWRLGPSSRS